MDKTPKENTATEEKCEETCPCPHEKSLQDCEIEPICSCPEDRTEIEQFPDSNYEEEKPAGVLSPDHPLLAKFQQALKKHLLKIQNQLVDEIADIDYNIKQKETEREDLGAKLYDLQQEICRQKSILEDYTKCIKEVHDKRVQHEKSYEITKKEYEDKLVMNKDAKRYHNERLMELNNLQALDNNIQKWAKEIEDEVTAAKRMVSKDAKDQRAIAEEKKKIDFLIFNLDSEVRKKENELNAINSQIREQNVVLNNIRGSLSDANADLEALQAEQKRLTQAWGEVIVAIGHRDKVLHQAKENLKSEQDKYKNLCTDIEGSKKEAAKEMEQNEKLEAFKARILEDIRNLKRQTDKQDDILAKYEDKIFELEALIKETENDYQLAKQEGNVLQVQLRSIQNKIDKIFEKKNKMEEEILKLAQEEIYADKANEYRMKILRNVQTERKQQECNVTEIEKSISNNMLDIERLKGIIIRLREDNDVLKKEFGDNEGLEDVINKQIQTTARSINMKSKQIEKLSKKYQKLLQETGGQEQTVLDLKIKGLEKQLQEDELKIRNLQQFWLTLQGHIVHLTEKRSNQINELQIARKQVMVINQKTLKTNLELEESVKQNQELERNINKLTKTVELLGVKLFEKKKNHEVEEEECVYIHFDLMEKLREAEMEVVRLEQEIVDLTDQIEYNKQMVLEKHREALSWETKYKMTEEIARWRRNENNNSDSELGNMRTEIRRMQVRYDQLKRAQEKLVQDLEFCVIHREKIFFKAMTRQKLDANQANRSRSTVQYKLNDMKNKMKQINGEISSIEKNLADVTTKYNELIQELCKKESEIENEKMQDKLIQGEIEEGMLMKHRNLENIVRKQHRAKRYRALFCNKVLPKLKNEAIIEKDMNKQVEVNENLIEIVLHLLQEFPEHKFYIKRIMATLQDGCEI